jgi:hypothetical protein
MDSRSTSRAISVMPGEGTGSPGRRRMRALGRAAGGGALSWSMHHWIGGTPRRRDPQRHGQGQVTDAESAEGTARARSAAHAALRRIHKDFVVVDGEGRCARARSSTRRAVLRVLRQAPRSPRRSVDRFKGNSWKLHHLTAVTRIPPAARASRSPRARSPCRRGRSCPRRTTDRSTSPRAAHGAASRTSGADASGRAPSRCAPASR